MFKWLALAAATLIATLISGCGGSAKSDPITPPIPVVQPIVASKTVQSGTADYVVAGDVSVAISPTVFTQASDLKVVVEPSVSKPPNPNVQLVGDRASITVTSSSPLQDKVKITISNLGSRFDAKQTYYGILDSASNGWKATTNFVVATGDTVELIADKTAFAVVNGVNTLKGTIAKFSFVAPIESAGLVVMASDNGAYYQDRVLVLVPGFNNSVSDLALAARKFNEMREWKVIYGYSYDWRKDAATTAKGLGIALDSIANMGRQIDIIAHSRGGLICRAAMENNFKTRNVLNFYSICTPHEGVRLANIGKLMDYLRVDYLNSTADNDQPFGLLAFDTEAASELFPGSSFLKNLNDPRRILLRGNVNYHIVGTRSYNNIGGGDYLAGDSTGMGASVPFELLTGGAVNRYPVYEGNHGYLLKNPDGIDYLIGNVLDSPRQDIEFTIEPKDVNYDFVLGYWLYNLKIDNGHARKLKIIDLAIDAYNKNGAWLYSQWYDPNTLADTEFPEDYHQWNQEMDIGETINLPISCHVDVDRSVPYDQAKPLQKAQTMAFTVRYQRADTKVFLSQRVTARLLGPYQYPTPPTLRSGGSRTVSPTAGLCFSEKR